MVPAQRSTIASIAGLAGASGSAFCKPLSRPAGSRPRHRSMQPMSRRTAPPMAVKGGEDAGHRSFAWRSDHKNPCPDGCFGASSGHSAHPWQCQRHPRCRRSDRGGRSGSTPIVAMMPTAFATPFGQRGQYRSFQANVRADVRSGTMSDATAIAGGSKLRSVASRTFVVLPHAMTSSPSTSCPPSSSPPSSRSGSE